MVKVDYNKVRYIGIDPGKKGGIFAVDGDGFFVGLWVMPLNGEGDTDFMALARLLREFPKTAHVVTELISPFQQAGKKQVASLARQLAVLECAILVNKLPWTKVNPKKWQGEMWSGQKMLTKQVKLDKEGTTKIKTDTKKISENAFRKIFPKLVDVAPIKRPRSADLHDGLVDAGLIALYGKRAGL